MLGTYVKAPEDRLDYHVDLAQHWLPEGDTLSGATATVSGGTAVIDSTDVSDDAVRVWVSGGAAGETNIITIEATSTGGRTKEVCFRLRIREC